MHTKTGWEIIFDQFNPDSINHEETVLMVGNGYVSTRGSFAEKYPGQNIATFMHGVYDDVPVSFTELANIPNWTGLQISVNGERLDLKKGELLSSQHVLDMKTATLTREIVWKNSQGQITALKFERFASLADVHLLCQRVEVTPINYSGEVEIITSLDAQVDNLGLQHWEPVFQECDQSLITLGLVTKASRVGLGMSQSMRAASHTIKESEFWNLDGHPSQRILIEVSEGKMTPIEKMTSVFSSRDIENPQLAAKKHATRYQDCDWETLRKDNAVAWAKDWEASDIRIESKDDAQLMVRFSIYQMLICAPRHDDRVSIGAKTLSGYGYRGHIFWDTEIFLLPFFIMTRPDIAKNLLNYRWNSLSGARKKAKLGGYEGIQFPWESAGTGDEVTPTWVPHFADPGKLVRIWTGDIEIHITSDIVYAINQYWKITGDTEFMVEKGIPLVLETAKFWSSRLEWSEEKQLYELTDVIGPDENHEHVNNNAFTNYSAFWNLEKAIEFHDWILEYASEAAKEIDDLLGISSEVVSKWKKQAEQIYFPVLTEDGIIEQFEGYFQLEPVDLSQYAGRTQSFQEIFGIEESNYNQIAKQADVVMLMHLFKNQFSKEVAEANYNYYTQRTDHEFGSSLGPSMFSLVASQIGKQSDAYEHFLRSAKADLYDIRGNIKDGIHAASLGGIWQDVVFGFAGLSFEDGEVTVSPVLPEPWSELEFSVRFQGRVHHIKINGKSEGVIR